MVTVFVETPHLLSHNSSSKIDPYPSLSDKEIYEKILDGNILPCPKECPSEIYHLMNLCWEVDPEKRVSFTQLTKSLKEIHDHLFGEEELRESFEAPPKPDLQYANPSTEFDYTHDPIGRAKD